MSAPNEPKEPDSDMNLFKPPVVRSAAILAGKTLNKALFTKTFDVVAARVDDVRHISRLQKALMGTKELLRLDRLSSVVNDPEPLEGGGVATEPGAKPRKRKCLLLRPSISPTSPDTWSEALKKAVESKELGMIPYKLTLDYDYWGPRDILESVLPEEFHDDIPGGFNTAGHVAHLNLRDKFMPYKDIVAQVIVDKNASIRTVINKTDLVGDTSAFRTFSYEVLAGPDDLHVEVSENGCTYQFDYSKVYWNSKLETEHSRLLGLFRPGEVVCDVMAGIGPFCIPAAKRGVFVWANDMNPDSYEALCRAIDHNKVGAYVRPWNEDGLSFICHGADLVREAHAAGEGALEVRVSQPKNAPVPCPVGTAPKKSKKEKLQEKAAQEKARHFVPVPSVVSHFVMNLPASAITFLPRYRGVYAGCEALFSSDSGNKLPLVHVHCFAAKNDDDNVPKDDVCARVSAELGVTMKRTDQYADVERGDDDGPMTSEPQHLLFVHNVRNVAPNKSMYCASFRLPAAVAFAARDK